MDNSNHDNNENGEITSTLFVVSLLVLAVIILPFTWFGPSRAVENKADEEKAPVYKVVDFYKACGIKFIELFAVDDSYDNCNVNSFYTDGDAYYIDFSDLIKGERYLCKFDGAESPDKRATFNLSTENFLTYTEVLEEMDEPEQIKPYISFYCEEYNIKDVAKLEKVRTTINAMDFKDMLGEPKPEDKSEEVLEESIEESTEDNVEASSEKSSETVENKNIA